MHMPLPEPNRWSRESRDAGMTLEHMLKTGGYPAEKAVSAFVSLHRDPDARSSNTAYDSEGRAGAALHPDRWDYGTLAHEAAHHITQQQNGWAFHDHSLGDSDIHGPQFAGNCAKTLGAISKGAGEDFLRHHADAVQLVRNYRARVHGMPWEEPERERGRPGNDGRHHDGDHYAGAHDDDGRDQRHLAFDPQASP